MVIRTILTLVMGLGLVSFSAGCSNSSDYCDRKCECEGCGDRQYDECIIERDYWEERASIYGCDELFLREHDCIMTNNDCTLDNFSPELSCADERVDLEQCIDANSTIR